MLTINPDGSFEQNTEVFAFMSDDNEYYCIGDFKKNFIGTRQKSKLTFDKIKKYIECEPKNVESTFSGNGFNYGVWSMFALNGRPFSAINNEHDLKQWLSEQASEPF